MQVKLKRKSKNKWNRQKNDKINEIEVKNLKKE